MKRVIILYADREGLWTREKYVGEVSLELIFGGFNMPIVFLNHMVFIRNNNWIFRQKLPIYVGNILNQKISAIDLF